MTQTRDEARGQLLPPTGRRRGVFFAIGAAVLIISLGAWSLRTPGSSAPPGVPEEDPSLPPRLLHAVVRIAADGGKGGGCGTLIDRERRLVVTAGTVVGGRDEVPVDFADEGAPAAAPARPASGRVVHRVPSRSLVVLQLDRLPEGAQPLSTGQEPPTPGQVLFTVRGGEGPAGDSWTCARAELERVLMPPHL